MGQSTSIAVTAENIAFSFSTAGLEVFVTATCNAEGAQGEQNDDFQTHNVMFEDEIEVKISRELIARC